MVDELKINTAPAGDGLSANVIRFGQLLRAHDIPVSFSSILDALKGLACIDISRLQNVYDLLRCNLIHKKEHFSLFEGLFRNFWLDEETEGLYTISEGITETGSDPGRPSSETLFSDEAAGEPEETPDEDSIRYSPVSFQRKKADFSISFEESEAIFQAMTRIFNKLPRRASRRYRYTLHGKKISLKRLLKKNMRFGGEPILLDYKKKKVKKRRIVIFCDVSGSMDIHTVMAFQFIHALKRIVPRTEIFFFSTDLARVTSRFRKIDFRETIHKLPDEIENWGGGTRIGHCLKTFNDSHGREWLSSKTIVMIFSDGWDRGEIDVLHDQMAYIKQKAFKIIWLNPLLGSADYQPICRGMKTALPFTDYFLSARRLHDFQYMETVLEKIIVN